MRDEALNRTIRILPSGDSIIQGVAETRYTDPSATALNRSYAYDAAGWLAQRTTAADFTEAFNYDARGQLNHESRWYPVTSRWYPYDAAGNPADLGAVVTTGNRLESYDGYALTYDADGNLLRKYKPNAGIDWTYSWNSLGQLTRASGTSNSGNQWFTITYGYDGWGRRVRQTVNGVTTRFLYDGQHVVGETDGSGQLTRSFTYYDGVDRPHSMTVAGQTFYYVADHQGNITGLVNSGGALINRYVYNSFGTAVVASEGIANPLRFAGGRVDRETGLSFNRLRYYDPALQRFMSEDPLGLAAGSNVYTYVGNNPLNLRDPSGMSPCIYGEVLINGKCVVKQVFLLKPLVVGGELHGSGYGASFSEREYIVGIAEEYAYVEELKQQAQDQLHRERIVAAVQSSRNAADLGVGFVPGVSTIHDATVLLSGYNVVTGDRVGLGGRGIALIGMVTPVSGGQIRAVGAVAGGAVAGSLNLLRKANGYETATRLGKQAQAALHGRLKLHGVSVTARVPDGAPSVPLSTVQQHFDVLKTGEDPMHYTVILPDPVTREAADLFNSFWGRTR